jgi:hypothetical protein
VIFGWIFWRAICRHQSGRASSKELVFPLLRRLVLASAILLVCILPCTIRNYIAFDQFVPVNSNAGFAFFWGNHPVHGTHFIPLLPAYGDLIPRELRGLNEAQMDRALLQRGIDFVLQDPVRYFLLSVSRASEYFKFWPSPDSGAVSNLVRVLSFGLCLPFLVSGVVIALYRIHHQTREDQRHIYSVAGLLLLVSGSYCLIHLLTWTLVRYRLPVDAMLMPFVALSMVAAYDRIFGPVRAAAVPFHLSTDSNSPSA